MSQPTREEVEAFITALNYGMKVSHKPEFLIALAEGWLKKDTTDSVAGAFKESLKDAEMYGNGFLRVDAAARFYRIDPAMVKLTYVEKQK